MKYRRDVHLIVEQVPWLNELALLCLGNGPGNRAVVPEYQTHDSQTPI
jgi:hypothetical protein